MSALIEHMVDADKTLGVPTNLEISIIAFLILLAVAVLIYVLFAPMIKSILTFI